MGHRTSVLLFKKKKNCEYSIYLIIDELELNLECWWGNQEIYSLDLECWLRTIYDSIERSMVTKSYLYLSLSLGWLRAFSILIWIWGDWEFSLSWSKSETTDRFLYLGLNLRQLRGFSILDLIWGDWEVCISHSEFEATKMFVYLILNLRWLRCLSILV